MKKITGIWIDKRIAKFLTFENNTENFQSIASSIEEFKPKGGSGTRLKGGPQDVVQDRKYTEREKHQQKSFFNSIIEFIEDSDEIVIFGPAEMREKLYAEIYESKPKIAKKVHEVIAADSMTDNQVKTLVRNYFKL